MKIKTQKIYIKSILLYSLISFSLILSGCNLEVAQPTLSQSESATNPANTTATTTTPVESGSSTSSSLTTTPSSAPNTKSTKPASTLVSGEDVQMILQRSADAMMAVESYDYISTNVVNFGQQNIESTTKATLFPARGDGFIKTTQGNNDSTTYLKNNRMYMVDPLTEKWVFMDMPDEPQSDDITIHERVNEYMTLTKQDDGYLLNSTHPLDALEFYSLTGIEVTQKDTLEQMMKQGQTMETMVSFVLDSNFRYQKVSYEQVTTTAGVSTYSESNFTYSNYDLANEIVIPNDVLKEATAFDDQNR